MQNLPIKNKDYSADIKRYNNNPNLKAENQKMQFTSEMAAEYMRCKKDPVYFIKTYVKIRNLDGGLVNFELYDFQEELVNLINKERFVIVKFPRQVGKALALDTKIYTPTGYREMKELQTGDFVYGDDGKPTKITAISDIQKNRKCYKVKFDNGEEIIADGQHLWTVNNSDWHSSKTLTTEEILNILPKKLKNGSSISIPVSKAIEFEEKKLPIEPYLFGLWLGDGNSYDARITCHKNDYNEYQKILEDKKIQVSAYREKSQTFNVCHLYEKLRLNDVLRNKHIPQEYITSSISQRVELIRGLMDSDGYCVKDKGSCEFYNKNLNLINSTRLILSSLGIKSRLKEKDIKGVKYYTIRFSTSSYKVFHLKRKSDRQKHLKNHKINYNHYIQSIESVDSVDVKCICVDNDSKLFLAGETLIPTHNSTTTVSYLLWVVLFHPFNELAILANKGDSARGILNRLRLAYEYIPLWMQQGVVQWNKGYIELENNSSIVAASTNSSAGRSGSYNMIMLDEFAFVPSNVADEFFKSVFPTISSGHSSKVVIVSTPNGMNLFYKKWTEAKKKRSNFIPFEANWWDVPGRDEEWKESQLKELGEEGFQQEHGGEFLGATNTLISASKLKILSGTFEDPSWSNGGFEMYEQPKEDGIYVISVDPSEGQGLDYSAFTVLDVSEMPYKVVAKYRNSQISPLIFPSVIAGAGSQYNDAYILIEVNGVGKEIANILHYELEYENLFQTTTSGGRRGQQLSTGHGKKAKLGVKTTASVKTIGCQTLKTLVEMDQLMVNDFDILSEMTTFVAKGKSFEAEAGCNDDLVMSLVLFAWLTNQQHFKDLTNSNVRLRLMNDKKRKQEEEMLPFGFVVNGADEEVTIDKDGTVWHSDPEWYDEEQRKLNEIKDLFLDDFDY